MAMGGTESPMRAWTSRLTPVMRGWASDTFLFLGAGWRGPAWPRFIMSRMSLVEAMVKVGTLWENGVEFHRFWSLVLIATKMGWRPELGP